MDAFFSNTRATLLDLKVPTLVVLGDRDPLMPSPARVREVASQTDNHVLLVVIEAHVVEPDAQVLLEGETD